MGISGHPGGSTPGHPRTFAKTALTNACWSPWVRAKILQQISPPPELNRAMPCSNYKQRRFPKVLKFSSEHPLRRKHSTREVSNNLKIKFNQQFISTLQYKHRVFFLEYGITGFPPLKTCQTMRIKFLKWRQHSCTWNQIKALENVKIIPNKLLNSLAF